MLDTTKPTPSFFLHNQIYVTLSILSLWVFLWGLFTIFLGEPTNPQTFQLSDRLALLRVWWMNLADGHRDIGMSEGSVPEEISSWIGGVGLIVFQTTARGSVPGLAGPSRAAARAH